MLRPSRSAAPALLTLALAACASDDPRAAPGERASPPAGVTCGGPIGAVVATASPHAQLDGSFPPQVERGIPTFAGTVTLTARQPLAGVASPAADVFVVREGTVVAVPLPKDALGVAVDLPVGGARTFEAVGTVSACAGPGARLAPDRYQVYAVVTVTGPGGPGSETVAVGGPWPLEVS